MTYTGFGEYFEGDIPLNISLLSLIDLKGVINIKPASTSPVTCSFISSSDLHEKHPKPREEVRPHPTQFDSRIKCTILLIAPIISNLVNKEDDHESRMFCLDRSILYPGPPARAGRRGRRPSVGQ